MSGGNWNYLQDRLDELGDLLLERETHPVILAFAKCLIEGKAALDILDRIRSGDASEDRMDEVLDAMRKVVPAAMPLAEALDVAEEARMRLHEEIERAKGGTTWTPLDATPVAGPEVVVRARRSVPEDDDIPF